MPSRHFGLQYDAGWLSGAVAALGLDATGDPRSGSSATMRHTSLRPLFASDPVPIDVNIAILRSIIDFLGN